MTVENVWVALYQEADGADVLGVATTEAGARALCAPRHAEDADYVSPLPPLVWVEGEARGAFGHFVVRVFPLAGDAE